MVGLLTETASYIGYNTLVPSLVTGVNHRNSPLTLHSLTVQTSWYSISRSSPPLNHTVLYINEGRKIHRGDNTQGTTCMTLGSSLFNQ